LIGYSGKKPVSVAGCALGIKIIHMFPSFPKKGYRILAKYGLMVLGDKLSEGDRYGVSVFEF
jgi:hypothetical protein